MFPPYVHCFVYHGTFSLVDFENPNNMLKKRKPAFVGLRHFLYVPAAEMYEAKV